MILPFARKYLSTSWFVLGVSKKPQKPNRTEIIFVFGFGYSVGSV